MALLSGFNQLQSNNQTFSDWLNKTNEMILMFRGDSTGAQTAVMTANALPEGSTTYGNATLFGQFGANAMIVFNEGEAPSGNAYANGFFGGLRGGNYDFSTNTISTDTLYVTSNTTFTDEAVEVYVNTTYGLIVEQNIEARHDVLFVGNGGSNTNPKMHWEDADNILSFNDDVRAVFGKNSGSEIVGGTGQMEMFFTGGRMYANTENLNIRANTDVNFITDTFELKSDIGSELYISANVADNSTVKLYYEGNQRLSTNTYGITVHGDAILEDDLVIFDSNKILMGGSTTYDGTTDLTTYKFQIFTDGTDSYIKADDRDLYVEVKEGFELTNTGRGTHYMTANATGENEVALFAAGTERLSTIDSASDADNSPSGVEIYGEANTTTLRTQTDANFDGFGGLNSNNVHWDASANTWNYRDATKITLGDSDDWEMFYTAAGRAYSNTDNMDIRARTDMNIITDVFELRTETGNELMLTANVADGVVLYWDNSAKLTTNTNGIYVHGDTIVEDNVVVFDNNKILMGGSTPYTGGELIADYNFQIYTDGTDGIIVSGGNDLLLKVDDNFVVQNEAGTVNLINANTSGEVTLYHNNVAKLQTNTAGIEVYGEANTSTARILGDANFDGSTGLNSNNVFWDASANTWHYRDKTIVTFGDSDDFTIKHDALDTYFQDTAGTGNVYFDTNTFIMRNAAGDESMIRAIEDAGVTLYFNNNNKLQTTSIGVNIEGEANTDTMRVQSTTDLEGNINVQGSTNADTLTWTKSSNTLNFDDNNYATFGTGGDLSVYHDATASRIDNATGNLVIKNNANAADVLIATDDGSGGVTDYIRADGSTGEVQLSHYGDDKLVTKSDGVLINGEANTGSLNVRGNASFESDAIVADEGALTWLAPQRTLQWNDNAKATFGDGNDLQIYHTANDSFIDDAGTGSLYILASTKMEFQTAGGAETYAVFNENGAVTINYDNSEKFATTVSGVNITGTAVTDGLTVDGTVDLNGNIDLGADVNSTITYVGKVDSNFLPSANNTYNLGSEILRWNNLHIADTITTLNITVEADIDAANNIAAATFEGDGAAITNLTAENIATGTINDARLPDEISSNISGTAAQANTTEIVASTSNSNFPVAFVDASGTYRQNYADTTFVFNPSSNLLTVEGLVVSDTVTFPSDVNLTGVTTFENIEVANTVVALNLEITSLVANGVAFTGTGDDVVNTADKSIDIFEIGQTQGFKYLVHGENLNDTNSAYMIEMTCAVTDNGDIYFTRYGEVGFNMDNVVLTPVVNTVPATDTIELVASCPDANATDIHRFKVLKIETRAA